MTDVQLRPDAFICYSRRNLDFATRLREQLELRGRSTLIDLEGIPATAEWWEEIKQAIRQADNFVFVLTPDAVASPDCRREVDYALDCGKRIITVHAQQTIQDVPEAIAKLQWVDGRDERDINSICTELRDAFDADLDFVRWHARVLTRAYEWERRSLDKGILLRGAELVEALDRLQGEVPEEPPLTDLQRRFIFASQSAHRVRAQRRLVIATLVLVVLGAIGGYAGWQFHRRSKERLSEEIAARARSALSDNAIVSLMMSLDALEEADTPAALQAFSSAISTSRVRGTLLSTSPNTVAAAFLPDGSALATLGEDGIVEFFSTETYLPLGQLSAPISVPLAVSFAELGDLVFVTGDDAICAWDVPELDPISCWQRDTLLGATHTPTGDAVLLSGVGVEHIDVRNDVSFQFPGLETTVCGEVVFDPSGHVMAVALMAADSSNSGMVLLLRDADGELVASRTRGMAGLPTQLALSAHGKRVLAVDERGTATLSDTSSGEEVYASNQARRVSSARFSPEGRWAIAVDESFRVTVLDTEDGQTAGDFVLSDPRLGAITVVDFVNDAPWIVAGGSTGAAIVVDSQGRELFSLSGGSELVNGIEVSPDWKTMVSFGEENLFWDLTLTTSISAIYAHEGSAETVRFLDDPHHLITGGSDGVVRLWDLVGPAQHAILGQHNDWVVASAPVPGRPDRIFSAGLDGVVRIFDLDSDVEWSAELHRDEDGHQDRAGFIWDVAVAPDGREMTTVGEDGALARVAFEPPTILEKLIGDGTPLASVAYSPSGELLAVGDNIGRIFVTEIDGGEDRELEGHLGPVMVLDFSSDGQRLLSISADASARLFETEKWTTVFKVTKHVQPLTTGGFSPDGDRFLTAGFDSAVKIWDTNSGDLVCDLDGHLDAVSAATFVGDNRIVTGSHDGRVRTWQVPEGRLLSILDLGQEVRSMDVTENGELIAAALADGRVILWPCPLCGDLDEAIADGYKTVAPFVAQIRSAANSVSDQTK